MTKPDAAAFVHEIRFDDLPPEVVGRSTRCLVDLLGVAAAGSATSLSRVARNLAVEQMAPSAERAALWFDGRQASPMGAALANGMTIDALDAHDGHVLTKGHSGAAVLPALLACVGDGRALEGRDLLTALVAGYEIAIRAGIVLHASTADYHTSGAWNAIGAAAVGARLLGFDSVATRHALGIAEFHGPRSPMMRCIDHPTMVKDGSGWGAMAGVAAVYLARAGFTGAPADTVEAPAHAATWADLGRRWRITEQYVKPYPVCRWAQPAVEAALALRRAHAFAATDIERVEIVSFHQAVRLAVRHPANTEEAQYSLPFPVAAALVRGRLGTDEIAGSGLDDPAILSLAARTDMSERDDFNACFPAERWAELRLHMGDRRVLASEPTRDRGNPDSPLSDDELEQKFHGLAGPVLGRPRGEGILHRVQALATNAVPVSDLIIVLAEAADTRGRSEATATG